MKQLLLKESAPGTGISIMRVIGPREVPEENEDIKIWHSFITVDLHYHKVSA